MYRALKLRRKGRIWALFLLIIAAFVMILNENREKLLQYGRLPSSTSEAPNDPHPMQLPSSTADASSGKEKKNIVFLKMVKCASSSVQNILMRYGYKHNLTFVLPRMGYHFGFKPFNPNRLVAHSSNVYNMFCHHTRFHAQTIPNIMQPDTVYISILRQPGTMFESLYTYLQYNREIGVDYRIFLDDPSRFYNPQKQTRIMARNPMSFIFGLETEDFNDMKYIVAFIADVTKRFDLVMIYEFFDESLVLLKDLLGWSWEDVVTFRVNARRTSHRSSNSFELMQKAEKWNWADMHLYAHFLNIFTQKVTNYGRQRMVEDVSHLRLITQEKYEECVVGVVTDSPFPGQGFRLRGNTSEDCALLVEEEMYFTEKIKHKLWPGTKFPDIIKLAKERAQGEKLAQNLDTKDLVKSS